MDLGRKGVPAFSLCLRVSVVDFVLSALPIRAHPRRSAGGVSVSVQINAIRCVSVVCFSWVSFLFFSVSPCLDGWRLPHRVASAQKKKPSLYLLGNASANKCQGTASSRVVKIQRSTGFSPAQHVRNRLQPQGGADIYVCGKSALKMRRALAPEGCFRPDPTRERLAGFRTASSLHKNK